MAQGSHNSGTLDLKNVRTHATSLCNSLQHLVLHFCYFQGLAKENGLNFGTHQWRASKLRLTSSTPLKTKIASLIGGLNEQLLIPFTSLGTKWLKKKMSVKLPTLTIRKPQTYLNMERCIGALDPHVLLISSGASDVISIFSKGYAKLLYLIQLCLAESKRCI